MPLIVGDFKHGAAIAVLDDPVEAGATAGMAGCIMPGDRHFQPDDVLIAVGPHLFHGLQVAGGLALLPEFLRERL